MAIGNCVKPTPVTSTRKLRHGRRYRGRGQGSQHISAVMERLGRSENLV